MCLQGGLVILSAKYGAAHAVKAADEAEARGEHVADGMAEGPSEAATRDGGGGATPASQPADSSRFNPRPDGAFLCHSLQTLACLVMGLEHAHPQ